MRFIMQSSKKEGVTQDDIDESISTAYNPHHVQRENEGGTLDKKLETERKKNKALRAKLEAAKNQYVAAMVGGKVDSAGLAVFDDVQPAGQGGGGQQRQQWANTGSPSPQLNDRLANLIAEVVPNSLAAQAVTSTGGLQFAPGTDFSEGSPMSSKGESRAHSYANVGGEAGASSVLELIGPGKKKKGGMRANPNARTKKNEQWD